MIIAEGMDNSGKTTLVQEIIKATGARLVPSLGKPNAEQAQERMRELLNDTDAKVYDRFVAFSDEVYGRVLRRGNILDPEAWQCINRVMRAGALVIYCRPPTDQILDFGERPQMKGVVEFGPRLIRRYDNMFDTIGEMGYESQIIRYDWTEGPFSTKSVIEEAKAHLAREKENHAYIGQLNKGVLSLG
jgi:hypothetical protein